MDVERPFYITSSMIFLFWFKEVVIQSPDFFNRDYKIFETSAVGIVSTRSITEIRWYTLIMFCSCVHVARRISRSIALVSFHRRTKIAHFFRRFGRGTLLGTENLHSGIYETIGYKRHYPRSRV